VCVCACVPPCLCARMRTCVCICVCVRACDACMYIYALSRHSYINMCVFQCVVDNMGGYFAPFTMLNLLHLRVHKQREGCFLSKNEFQQPQASVSLLPAKSCAGMYELTRAHTYRDTRKPRTQTSMYAHKHAHAGTYTRACARIRWHTHMLRSIPI